MIDGWGIRLGPSRYLLGSSEDTDIRRTRDLTLILLLVTASLLAGPGHELVCQLEEQQNKTCLATDCDSASVGTQSSGVAVAAWETEEFRCPGCFLTHQRVSLDLPAIRVPAVVRWTPTSREVLVAAFQPRPTWTTRGPPAA